MKVVGAIIQNGQGQFLLQQRDDKAPTYPLCWTLFGGIAKNETPEKAIIRELIEELGLKDLKDGGMIQRNIQTNGTEQFIFHIITTTPITDLKLNEGLKMEYIEEKELFNREFAFNIKDVLENFIRRQKRL